MGKHLLDETVEFRMPRIPRHAAEDEAPLEETQRFDPVSSQLPVPGSRQGSAAD